MADADFQIISDDASERETAYLLKSPEMKERLLQAMKRDDRIPFEEAIAKLGL